MINVYLCEDEEMQLDFIRSMLETGIAERKIDATIISARKSPRDTLLDAKSRKNEKSLFVIDIQLNDFSMNGIDLARELKENTCTKELNISRIFEKGYSDKGEGRGNGLSWVKNMIEKHDDLYHECRISDGKIIQILEMM